MMGNTASRNFVVGLFAIVAIAALAVLVILFDRGAMWVVGSQTYPVQVKLREAAGTRAGNLVTLNGIEIGRVSEVGLFDSAALAEEYNVRVTIQVDTRYQLTEGTTARLTEPVLGQGRPPVEILPGDPSAPALAAGSTISGEVRGAVESIFPGHVVSTFTNAATQISDSARALTPVLSDLHEILEKRDPTDVDRATAMQGNLSSAMARLDQSLRHFNDVLGDPETKSQLRDGVANLYQMTEDGKLVMSDFRSAATDARELMATARGSVDKLNQTITGLDGEVKTVSRSVRGSLNKMDSFLDTLNQIAQPIARGEGTIGRIIRDNELYETLVLTMRRLGEMLEEYRLLAKEWQKGRIKIGV